MIAPNIASFVLATGCLILIEAEGCRDLGPGQPEAPRVRSIAIVPDSVTLSVGESATIRAIVTLVDGSMQITDGVKFWSSDTTVATVSFTGEGPGLKRRVIGRAIGEASITASFRGESGWAKVIVN